MKTHLAIIMEQRSPMWIDIDYENKILFITTEFKHGVTGKGKSEIVVLERYAFDNVNEFINKYGKQYILYFHVFLLRNDIIKINKRNINKLIKENEEYEYKNHYPIIYLYRYQTKFLEYKPNQNEFIERLEIL